MSKALSFIVFIILIYFAFACSTEPTNEPLFEALDSTGTHIGFVNRVENSMNGLTLVDYLYYYNGAGVAACDINNDGMTDLFFVSNLHENKLYLNQGNLKFKDISTAAGIQGYSHWKTGITVADVNGDGWQDFYLCAVSNYKGLEGSNELYINNGDNTFSERSAEFGLDFSGMATQSVFFDYDHDSDLDMFLITHAAHNARSYDRVMGSGLTDQIASDHLYRNDNGVFHDVSAQAGIDPNSLGYGLGLTVADLNDDGWDDVYVANDFYEGDDVYINRGDGSFRQVAEKIFDFSSRYARGCDITDLNNDGLNDLMTVDVRPASDIVQRASQLDDDWQTFHYKKAYHNSLQFSRNVLQQNRGGLNFSEVAAFAGVESSDWSWSVLLADFNNDGHKDIFTTQGIPEKMNDLDYLEYAHKDSMRYAIDLSVVHIQRALHSMPDGKANNHLYENQKGLRFMDRATDWGFASMRCSNGAMYADLDNDGDLDIVTNDLNGPVGVYRNRTRELNPDRHFIKIQLKGKVNKNGTGAKVLVKTKEGLQVQHVAHTRGFLSSVSGPLFFGLGKTSTVDSIMVLWPGNDRQLLTNVKGDQQVVVDQSDETSSTRSTVLEKNNQYLIEMHNFSDSIFVHHENEYYDFYREPLMPFLVSREGPALTVGDVNGDGLDDYYIGGAKHQSGKLYVGQPDGKYTVMYQPAFNRDKLLETVDALFIDVDGDRDVDLYAVSGGNEFYNSMRQQEDRLYLNDGSGNFTRDVNALPPMLQNKNCVRAGDMDGDQDIDLFVGGRVVPFQYGKPAASFILINDGHGKFTDKSDHYNLDFKKLGMVTDAQWTDLDKDGALDLIVVGDWMPVRIFLNKNGSLNELRGFADPLTLTNIQGLWQCLSVGDFDHDGDTDFMAGNLGLNSILKSKFGQAGVRLYMHIDEKGQTRSIPARAGNDGIYYPAATRDELGRQYPGLFEKTILSNKAYAMLDMDAIGNRMNITWQNILEVDQFASLYFENINGKKFKIKVMPADVQLSKVYAIAVADVNNDGSLDALVGGNMVEVSPAQGTYKASRGTVLLGNGLGDFKALTLGQGGLNIRGSVRKIRAIRSNNEHGFLFALNADSLKFYKKNK